MHAYRSAGYLVWDALLEGAGSQEPERLGVLMRSATLVWAAMDAQAAAASEAYRATETELRRRTDEQLQALLDALLEGQESPGLAARAAAGLDLPERGAYAVVVLRAERRDRREACHRPLRGAGYAVHLADAGRREVGRGAAGPDQGLDAVAQALERAVLGARRDQSRGTGAGRSWGGRGGWPNWRCGPVRRTRPRSYAWISGCRRRSW